MQRRALTLAMKKARLRDENIGAVFAGDLLNQCISSAYGLVDYNIPQIGLYGACSTAAESLLLSASAVAAGYVARAAAVTSSHNCSAERQYRTPLEYGAVRAPTSQWTVTGSGAFIVGACGNAVITEGLPGITLDSGVTDAANMGAAMAPAALDTLKRYFAESGKNPADFDMILTGDLGAEGTNILLDLADASGLHLRGIQNDCGLMIYSPDQEVQSGGSGCGCSAVVLAAAILPKLEAGELTNILFVGTGALMSPDSLKQGLSIPAVAHLVHIERKAAR